MAIKATISLTRPKQWPILSAQFFVGVVLFIALQEPGDSFSNLKNQISWWPLFHGWLAWVILLNGGTLAFNSAFDRDIGPVAYLRNPPVPPPHLATNMFMAMTLGVVLGWQLVSATFGYTVGACVVLSVLYSHHLTRWKSIPGLDLLVNILGYGAGTTLGGLLVGAAMLPVIFPSDGKFFIAGFGLLFGSLYPLTQIYQVHEDQLRGDRTLASTLGIKTSLVVAVGLGLLATVALLAGIYHNISRPTPIFLLGGLGLWIVHLIWWWLRTDGMSDAQHERGMYRALVLWALVDITLLIEILLR